MCAIAGAERAEVLAVVEAFRRDGRAFLVVSGEADANPLIDISHESLIRQWTTLEDWVNEEVEAAKTYARLVESEALHRRGNSNLLRDAELTRALDWLETIPAGDAGRAWGQRYHRGFDAALVFLEASRGAEEQRKLREAREREEKERLLQEKTRALRRSRWMAGAMAVLAVVMFGVAWMAWVNFNHFQQSEEARIIMERQRQLAEAKTLEANYNLAKLFEEKALAKLSEIERKQLKPNDPERTEGLRQALLYALEAQRQAVPVERVTVVPATFSRLSQIDSRWLTPERKQTPALNLRSSVNSIVFSPDGKTLASGSSDYSIRLWDAHSGASLKTLQDHSGAVNSVAFSPDGKTLASGSDDHSIRLWEPEHLAPILRLLYEFDPVEVADALEFLWNLRLDELNFVPNYPTPALFPQQGYYITWDEHTEKFRPLLDAPRPDETKMDQLVRWLEARKAYRKTSAGQPVTSSP
ncbi:MAG: WD40 repeat domain-containing protein [Thiolinea sp.]